MAGRLEESKIRLTQPSLAGTGAELGNILQLINKHLGGTFALKSVLRGTQSLCTTLGEGLCVPVAIIR